MLLDLIFPKTCLSCGRFGGYICQNCRTSLEYFRGGVCIYCEQKSSGGLTHPWCKKPFGVDGYLGIFYYNTTLKKIIKGIKYRLITDAWGDFFSLWENNLESFYIFKKNVPEALLQPIPLHRERYLKRGFNQSDYIARFFSKKLHYPTISILNRARNTPPQAQLKIYDRHNNLRGAFKANYIAGLHNTIIILVDDVVTTGSTVYEAASALKKEGAGKVFVFSVAKG